MRTFVYTMLAALLLASCGSKTQTISGDLANLGDVEISISKFTPMGPEEVAKAKSEDGKFLLEYTPDEPNLFFFKTEKFNIPVFIDNSSIKIQGDADLPEEIVIEGSESHEQYKALEEEVTPISEEQTRLRQEYRKYSQTGDEENMKAVYDEYEELQTQKVDLVKGQIFDHGDSYVSAFLANMYFSNSKDIELLKEVTTKLSTKLEGYSYYDGIMERFETADKVSIGKVAPEIVMNDVDGNPFKLSSLKGKYVLLDFWASWCGPCRRENPNVVKMFGRYGGDQFTILGISLDDDKEKWVTAIEDDQLDWHHVSDLKKWDSAAAALYGVRSIPHTVLIDPDGKIIAKNLRGAELEAKIASLVQQ